MQLLEVLGEGAASHGGEAAGGEIRRRGGRRSEHHGDGTQPRRCFGGAERVRRGGDGAEQDEEGEGRSGDGVHVQRSAGWEHTVQGEDGGAGGEGAEGGEQTRRRPEIAGAVFERARAGRA